MVKKNGYNKVIIAVAVSLSLIRVPSSLYFFINNFAAAATAAALLDVNLAARQ